MAKRDRLDIPEPKIDQKITFSFEFYDIVCKYCISQWGQNKTLETLKRLREINRKTVKELFHDKRVYHFHPVDWSETIEKKGFPEENANKLEAYQFSLLGINNQKAGVYGAVSRNIFYIVWFDLEHAIWPTFKK